MLAQGQSAQEELAGRPVARTPAGTFFVFIFISILFYFFLNEIIAKEKKYPTTSENDATSIVIHQTQPKSFPPFSFSFMSKTLRVRARAQAFQLPRQDLALAYCRYVEPQNHTSYQDFVTARNDIALDIAYVKETNTRALVRFHSFFFISTFFFVVL